MEHVQSLGRDVVLLAIPMGTARPYTLSSGTAFPGSLALGALLVATEKQSATHPRQADLKWIRKPYCLTEPSNILARFHTSAWGPAPWPAVEEPALLSQPWHQRSEQYTVPSDLSSRLLMQGAHRYVLSGRDASASDRAACAACS